MTFLPIVGRELRVAARRRFTFWGRVAAAGICLMLLLMLQALPFAAGPVEFGVLRWLAFGYAALAGVFLTADALSEEKREGTLGLLFLTDLRGHDVVLGKLAPQFLRAFYPLLAAMPVLALTLLAGGVTGAEFWRSVLVICNTLFFSLALGLLVSSVSRDALRAMSATLLLSAVFHLGLPWIDSLLVLARGISFEAHFSVASPGWLMYATDARWPRNFWFCLILQHAIGWGFLLLASLLAPRLWQEKGVQPRTFRWGPAMPASWSFGRQRARSARRQRLLDTDPLYWLASRDRRSVRIIGLLALLNAGMSLFQFYWTRNWLTTMSAGGRLMVTSLGICGGVVRLAMDVWIIALASGFLLRARQSGLLELILTTPVRAEQVVRGQWRSLTRTLAVPVLCAIVVVAMQIALLAIQNGPQTAVTGNTVVTQTSSSGSSSTTTVVSIHGFGLISTAMGLPGRAASLAAFAWFGMWMGLTNRKIGMAVLKTYCWVALVPGVLATICAGFAIGFLLLMGGVQLVTIILSLVPLCFWVGCIFWARRRLLTRFRQVVTGDSGSFVRVGLRPPPVTPPPLPAALPPR